MAFTTPDVPNSEDGMGRLQSILKSTSTGVTRASASGENLTRRVSIVEEAADTKKARLEEREAIIEQLNEFNIYKCFTIKGIIRSCQLLSPRIESWRNLSYKKKRLERMYRQVQSRLGMKEYAAWLGLMGIAVGIVLLLSTTGILIISNHNHSPAFGPVMWAVVAPPFLGGLSWVILLPVTKFIPVLRSRNAKGRRIRVTTHSRTMKFLRYLHWPLMLFTPCALLTIIINYDEIFTKDASWLQCSIWGKVIDPSTPIASVIGDSRLSYHKVSTASIFLTSVNCDNGMKKCTFGSENIDFMYASNVDCGPTHSCQHASGWGVYILLNMEPPLDTTAIGNQVKRLGCLDARDLDMTVNPPLPVDPEGLMRFLEVKGVNNDDGVETDRTCESYMYLPAKSTFTDILPHVGESGAASSSPYAWVLGTRVVTMVGMFLMLELAMFRYGGVSFAGYAVLTIIVGILVPGMFMTVKSTAWYPELVVILSVVTMAGFFVVMFVIYFNEIGQRQQFIVTHYYQQKLNSGKVRDGTKYQAHLNRVGLLFQEFRVISNGITKGKAALCCWGRQKREAVMEGGGLNIASVFMEIEEGLRNIERNMTDFRFKKFVERASGNQKTETKKERISLSSTNTNRSISIKSGKSGEAGTPRSNQRKQKRSSIQCQRDERLFADVQAAMDSCTMGILHDIGVDTQLDFDVQFSHHPIVVVGSRLFMDFLGVHKINYVHPGLLRALQKVENGYLDTANYHNKYHGAMVGHQFIALLRRTKVDEALPHSPQTWMSLLLAGLGHDIGHPARNGGFLAQRVFAFEVGGECLEIMHCSLLFGILQRPECQSDMALHDDLVLRRIMLNLILATDMATHHAKTCEELSAKVPSSSPRWIELMLRALIKAADLSHCYVSWRRHLRWSQAVCDEFYSQGGEEVELGFVPVPFMDRNNHVSWAASQEGFMSFVAVPLFTGITNQFHDFKPILDQAKQNQAQWTIMKNRGEIVTWDSEPEGPIKMWMNLDQHVRNEQWDSWWAFAKRGDQAGRATRTKKNTEGPKTNLEDVATETDPGLLETLFFEMKAELQLTEVRARERVANAEAYFERRRQMLKAVKDPVCGYKSKGIPEPEWDSATGERRRADELWRRRLINQSDYAKRHRRRTKHNERRRKRFASLLESNISKKL